jgi:hypothetical protein
MGAEQRRKTAAVMSQGIRGHYCTDLPNPPIIIMSIEDDLVG